MGENYKPLLSVIITAYNREKFLEECIYSIRQQTYKNLEILIIDDCSTDNTEKLIKNIQQDDERIKYMKHNINKGAGAAKNTGIENATGKYITFVDSDDKLANTKAYEIIINKLENDSSIDVYCYGYTKKENNKITNKHKKYKIDSSNIYKPSTMVPLKVFKTNQIKKVRNNEKIKFDDLPFWVDFCLTNAPTIYHSKNKFYILREDNESITRNEKNMLEMFEAYMEIESIINKKAGSIENKEDILYRLLNSSLMRGLEFITDDKLLEEYRNKGKEYLKSLDSSLNIIGSKLSHRFYAFFIDNETARNNYLKDIEIYKDNKYYFIIPNRLLFKIGRETKRIINQIKKVFYQ